jgi:hypothetical protein
MKKLDVKSLTNMSTNSHISFDYISTVYGGISLHQKQKKSFHYMSSYKKKFAFT